MAKSDNKNLYKLSIYARNKGKAGYPKLSYSVWKHVACNKLQISEELAWLYFETFDSLSGSSFKEHSSWDKRFAQCTSVEEIDHLRCQGSVRTLQFILFLYIQQIHKISFKASLVSGGEEWPTRSRSPDLENKGSVAVKSLDEHDHMMFVLHHLNDILELLMEPESSANGSGNEACLTVEALDALGFLITGSIDRRTIQPLHELARLQPERPKCGYSKISRTFSFRQLQSWLRSNLQVNPFGVSAILAEGFKQHEVQVQNFLSLSDTFDENSLLQHHETEHSTTASKEPNTNRSRIMSNVSYAPPEQRVIILSQVCKQTVAKASDSYSGSTVKIHRCHYSYIYVLCPLRAVIVENCHNSTIVLGVAKKQLSTLLAAAIVHFLPSARESLSVAVASVLLIFARRPDL
ncbi:TBCC domain-containing protein 1 [Desmophyllum pertusum]|uniref:TBCC domain-containing protein 1 n=1 Tax=Desmophyllum pertusum TaxID=174260 RepID=A0A9X0CUM2_9CNID|nr:TBCC domain-containing protein 1 [Desmophyllum pertusum]